MEKFRIISFDGGGIRGIYTLALLQRIWTRVPELFEETHLLAGTSTGGIIALGLAYGITPPQGVALYRRFGKEVFVDSWLDDLRDLWGLVGAEYDIAPLERILEEIFGSATLGDLYRRGKYVLIPTFDLDAVKDGVRGWKPKFFHNFPGLDSDEAERIMDVAVRTSAAPTYFPTYQGYIDGGVVANNPSMAALAQVLSGVTDPPQQLRNIRLLSFGTGYSPDHVPGEQLDWGYAQWGRPLLSLILGGMMETAAYQCRQLLQDTGFHRLAPILPQPVSLDETDKIEFLLATAKEVDIGPTLTWIRAHYL